MKSAIIQYTTLIILCVMMLVPHEVVAQEEERDSLEVSSGRNRWWQDYSDHTTEFRATQLIAPGILVTVGALGIGENAPLRKINLAVRNGMTKLSNGQRYRFDDYMQYVPVASYVIMCATPLKAKHTVAERMTVAAVTYLSMTAMTNTLKYTICEQRPGSTERNAFPSGHTATAFAGAELIRSEYGWGIGSAAYVVASGVAFMRLYNNRHWLNDVLAGAGIGILSARIGYWLLPLWRKMFRLEWDKSLVATPAYYPEQRALGLSCAMCF